MAIHAVVAARDFFLAGFCPSSLFTCFFSKASPKFFLCWLWLTPVPVWAHRINRSPCSLAQIIHAGSRVECLRNIDRLQNMCNFFLFLNLQSEIVDIIRVMF